MSLSVNKPLAHVAGELTQAAKSAKPKRAPKAPKQIVKNEELLQRAQELEAKIKELESKKRNQLKSIALAPFRAVYNFAKNDIKKTGEDITAAHSEVKRQVRIIDWNVDLHKRTRAAHAEKNGGKTTLGMKIQAGRDALNTAVAHPVDAVSNGFKKIGNGFKAINEALEKREARLNAQAAADRAAAATEAAAAKVKAAEQANIDAHNAGVKSRAKAASKAKAAQAKADATKAKAAAAEARKIADAPRQAMLKTQREQKWNQLKFDTRRGLVATGNGIASGLKAASEGIASFKKWAGATAQKRGPQVQKGLSTAGGFGLTAAKYTGIALITPFALIVGGTAWSGRQVGKGISGLAKLTGRKASALSEKSGLKAALEVGKEAKALAKELKGVKQADKALTVTKTVAQKAAEKQAQLDGLSAQFSAIQAEKDAHIATLAKQLTTQRGLATKAKNGKVSQSAVARQAAEVAATQAKIAAADAQAAKIKTQFNKLQPKPKAVKTAPQAAQK